MFYIMYLTGLCSRRHWPQPIFSSTQSRSGGWQCKVRVNNREYSTDRQYETEQLARDAAATRAYMICRNFSVNDGMYPGERPGRGDLGRQGLPAAIGSGRGSRNDPSHHDRAESVTRSSRSNSDDWSAASFSGGESPRSLSSGKSLRSNVSTNSRQHAIKVCYCQRDVQVMEYGRCQHCVREALYS